MASVVNMGELYRWAFALGRGMPEESSIWLVRRLPLALMLEGAEFPGGVEEAIETHVRSWDWLERCRETASQVEIGILRKAATTSLAAVSSTRSGMGVIVVDANVVAMAEAEEVRDWLAALPESDPKLFGKLGKVNWVQAVSFSRAWHGRMARKAGRVIPPSELAKGTRKVLGLQDGWAWVRLETESALDREGQAMGHCVGSGGYDGLVRSSPPNGIHSLRDPTGCPHLTVEIRRGCVVQVKGFANADPVGQAKRLRALALCLGVSPGHRPGALGLARVMGRTVNVETALDALKAGMVEGDVLMSGADIDVLPGCLDVMGDLWLGGCVSLTELPSRMHVGGSLILTGCARLEDLPRDLSVGSDLHLTDCRSLGSLPSETFVGRSLYAVRCLGLTELLQWPDVGLDINLAGCANLMSLPPSMRVKGSLHLNGCRTLTALPEGLKVNDHLFLDGCSYLTRMPSDMEVGGNLYLRRCPGLGALPTGLLVGGRVIS